MRFHDNTENAPLRPLKPLSEMSNGKDDERLNENGRRGRSISIRLESVIKRFIIGITSKLAFPFFVLNDDAPNPPSYSDLVPAKCTFAIILRRRMINARRRREFIKFSQRRRHPELCGSDKFPSRIKEHAVLFEYIISKASGRN